MWSPCPCVSTIARTRRSRPTRYSKSGTTESTPGISEVARAHARVHEEALSLPLEDERVEAELAEPRPGHQAQPAGINRQELCYLQGELTRHRVRSDLPRNSRRSPPLRGAELTGWLPLRRAPARWRTRGHPQSLHFHCPKPPATG